MFGQYFSIIEKEKFPKKFQNIGNLFDFDKDNDINSKEKNKKKKKGLIFNIIDLNEKKRMIR